MNTPNPRTTPEPPRSFSRGSRKALSAAWLYALFGLLLGAGAPAGALLIRMAMGVRDLRAELREHEIFYGYQLIGTCAAFAISGWIVGRRADREDRGRDYYRELAEHDALTGLANARVFAERQQRALQHAERYQEPLSLLLIDVDELKSINDTFGHDFGSAALVHVADVLRECKREDDLAARWGGDEFALLLRGADADAARRQAETILAKLRVSPVRRHGVEKRVSVTIGMATMREKEGNVFERADRALYAGKAAGRDRVIGD